VDVEGRAYTLFSIKSIDAERRTISGVASTPEMDADGDIVDPQGLSFDPEIPLLLFHDVKSPVGWARLWGASKDGINVTAQVAQIDEDGAVKRRLDEAWHSIKARLITGFSLKVMSTREHVKKLATGGLHWQKAHVPEISLVTFPANKSARIITVKSLDAASRAASGHGGSDPSRPGATGNHRHTMKSTSERLTEIKATLKAKGDRLAEIVDKEDRTAEERSELETLKTDSASLTEEIGNLEALESVNAALATPITGRKATHYVIPSVGAHTKDTTPPGIHFARFVMCKMAAAFDRDVEGRTALHFAQHYMKHDPLVMAALKANVPAATTTDPTWASPLVEYNTIASEFIEFLRPTTIIGQIPGLRRVPFFMRAVGQTTGGSAAWVGEGRAKPLTRFAFNATTLAHTKLAAISVLTDDVVRFSSPSAEGIVRDALADAIRERGDLDFIDPSNAGTANIKPASITNAATPLTSQGNSAEDVRADIAALVGAFVTENMNVASLVLIMPNTLALMLSLMRNAQGVREFPDITVNGGTLEGIPVVASQYAVFGSPTGSLVIALNASELFLADDGNVTVSASREASLEMDDAPSSRSSSPVTESTLVSMFQTNSVALRAERSINWALRRTEAVQYMEDVDWAVGSP
jgi:HK97 family phage major capsid protein